MPLLSSVVCCRLRFLIKITRRKVISSFWANSSVGRCFLPACLLDDSSRPTTVLLLNTHKFQHLFRRLLPDTCKEHSKHSSASLFISLWKVKYLNNYKLLSLFLLVDTVICTHSADFFQANDDDLPHFREIHSWKQYSHAIPPDLDHVVIAPELLIKNKTTNHSPVHILSLTLSHLGFLVLDGLRDLNEQFLFNFNCTHLIVMR